MRLLAAGLFAAPVALLAIARAADWYPGNGAAMSGASASFYLPSPELMANCGVLKTVKQAAGGDYTTISGAITSLGVSLSTNTCVVVLDQGNYTEAVTLTGIDTAGYRLRILKDPMLPGAPTVQPMVASPAFRVNSDSVTIRGINISMGMGSEAVWFQNSDACEFSQSTITHSGGTYAIYFDGASTNTVSEVYVSNLSGDALHFSNGSNSNVVSQSMFNSAGNDMSSVYIELSSSNTLTGSFVYHQMGYGVHFGNGASYNTVSLSTVTGIVGTDRPVYYENISGPGNRVEDSSISNPGGTPVYFGAAGTVSGSRIESGTMGAYAVHFVGGNALVTGSVLRNSAGTAVLANSTGGNRIERSTVTAAAGAGYYAVSFQTGGNTLADSYVINSAGTALFLSGSGNIVSGSTVTGNGAASYALQTNSASNTLVTRSLLHNPSGTSVTLGNWGTDNAVSYSTITNSAGNYPALYINQSPTTVTDCYVAGSTAAYVRDANPTRLYRNVLVSTWTGGLGLGIENAGVYTASHNVISGGPGGTAISLDRVAGGASITLSSNTIAGGSYGVVFPSAFVTSAVSTLTFRALSPGATAIQMLNSNYSLAISSVYFNSANIAVNINAAAMTGGAITVTYPFGQRASQFLANDPAGRIIWPWPGARSLMGVYGSTVSVGVGTNGARGYQVVASTDEFFNGNVISTATAQQLSILDLTGLAHNTTYYVTAGALWDKTTYYYPAPYMNPVTQIEDPTSVYIDEVGSTTIVASAYAPGSGFTNMQLGQSGVAISTDGAYDLWGSSGNYWTARAPLPAGRVYFAAVSLGGKVYAFGGFNSVNLKTSTVYDPVSNGWTPNADMTVAREYLAAAAAGGKIYVLGGLGGPEVNEEYDPASNTWRTKAQLMTPRTNLVAAAVGGKVYVMGGHNGMYLDSTEEYDPATDTWTARNGMLTPRANLAAAVVNGKIYALGGTDGDNMDVNEEYDPVSGNWTARAPMPQVRFMLSAAAVGGKVLAISGHNGTDYVSPTAEYDPETNGWVTRASIITPRLGLSAVAARGKVYALGGVGGNTLNQEYTPGTSRVFTGLQPNRLHTFHAKARNQEGLVGAASLPDVSTYTLATVALMADGNTFENVYTSSVVVRWSSGTDAGGYNGEGASYVLQGSTAPDFTGTLTVNNGWNPVHMENLLANTTYHFRIKAYNVGGYTDDRWLSLGSTVTHIEEPTSVYIDEVTTTTIVASAYAPAPAFTGLERGLSAVSIAKNEIFDLWGSSGNYWNVKQGVLTGRHGMAAGAIGGRLYFVGGFDSIQSVINEEYDPVSNGWVTKASMTVPRRYLAAGVAKGKLYAVGGENSAPKNDNEAYDPVSNTWETRKQMPTARYSLAAAVIDGKIYFVGGNNGTNIAKNEMYDPDSNTWTTKADMPAARDQLGAAALGGKLYAVGGTDGLTVNEEYDPAANIWSTKTSMPTARYGLAAEAANGKLYAVGGFSGVNLGANEEYDPVSDSWAVRTQMPTPRRYPAVAVAGGRIYAAGGIGGMTANEEFNPGLSRSFTGLAPNTLYTFKAKARNLNGIATGESVTISTRTLAAVALPETGSVFGAVYASSVAVRWSPGTAAGGYNGAWASYLVVASTSPDYLGTTVSSHTYAYTINSATLPLASNTTYYFRVQAYNAGGMTDYSWLNLGSTVTMVNPPLYMPAVNFSSYSVTLEWGSNGNGPDTWYNAQAATDAGFTAVAASSVTQNSAAVISGLQPNTYYYTRVMAVNQSGSPTEWVNLDSLATDIEPVQGVYFDEIGTNTITASAYAPTPAFTGLSNGSSGINVTTGVAYGDWTVGGDAWAVKMTITNGRYLLAGASLNGKVYTFGGYNGVTYFNTVQAYDPVNNTQATLAPMPNRRHGLAAAAVGGKIYALGGSVGAGQMLINEEYDPASNTWVTKSSMTVGRYSFAAAAVNGKVYTFGDGVVEEYDPGLDIWTTRAPLSDARTGLAAAVVSGRIYVVGGTGPSSLNEEYDPVLNSWTTRAPMPTARLGLGAASVGGKVYAYGGLAGSYSLLNEEYDPAANAWLTRNSTLSRYYFAMAAARGKIYASGGSNGSYLTANYEYTPGVAKTFEGLQPNTLYNFKARSRNQSGNETSDVQVTSTRTLAGVALADSGQTFAGVYFSSAAVAWSSGTAYGGYNGPGASFLVVASTSPDYLGLNVSSYTYNVSGATLPLAANTTYYFRVQAYNSDGYTDYSWLVLGSTVTRIEAPTSVYIDEVGVSTIVASAYAPGAAFTGLERLGSGVAISSGNAYDLWGSTGNYWVSKAVLPTARFRLAAGVIGGRLYVLGGDNGSALNTNEEYDPAVNAWTTKTALPTARQGLAAGVTGGRLYAVGGYSSSYLKTNEEYDPAANAWTTKAQMPTARYAFSAGVIAGKLYAVGGFNGAYPSANEEYDPAVNAWTTKAPLPTPRSGLAAGVIGGKLYAAGGNNGSNLAINEEYDPAANAWTTKTPLPAGRARLAAGVIGGKLYAVGGHNGSEQKLNEAYDPSANAWTTMAPLSAIRSDLAAGVIGGKLYAVGGYDSSYLNANEVYDPGTARSFSGLQPNTQYTFKAKARGQDGTVTGESVEVSTYTLAYVGLPAGGQPFGAVYASSAAVNWSSGTATLGYNGAGASFLVVASTSPNYLGTNISSYTYNVSGATLALAANTTHYFRVQAYNAGGMTDYSWLVLGSTSTRIETPTSVYIDEVTTTTIVASAYAPNPAFTGLDRLGSGVAISSGNAYDLWGSSGNYWAARAQMSISRYHAAAGAIGGKIYAVGGFGSGYESANEEYDPAVNSWSTKASMPTPRYDIATGVIGGKLYAVGGHDGGDLTVNEEYDPVSDAWTTRQPMPTPRSYAAAGVINGKLYVAGGGGGGSQNEAYDPATDSWESRADMPTPRGMLSGAVADGKLYAIGGAGPSGKNEEYDPASDSWSTKADLPTPRYGLAVGSLGGKVYAVNGYGSDYLDKNEEYDPASNTWTTRAPMLNAALYFPAVTAGGKMYIIGGSGTPNQNVGYDPGTARRFTSLQPNTLYTFKAKARNQAGAQTGDSATVSTYTLAAVAPSTGAAFAGVTSYGATIYWSSGTGTSYNGSGARYKLQASTAADFSGNKITITTHTIFAFIDLGANTSFYFRIQTYNAGNMTDYSWQALGSTVTLAATPAAQAVTAVSTYTITAAWGANGNAGDTWYTAQAASDAGFASVVASSLTRNTSAELGPLAVANTYYYLRVNALNRAGSPTPWTALGSTVTAVETPASVYFDEVGTNTITASAYAPSPAFTGLHMGLSGVNITTAASYGVWGSSGGYWNTRAPLPTGRYYLSAVSLGGRIYALGGYTGAYYDKNEEYDPAANLWATRAPMTAQRREFGAAVVGGVIYVLGGSNSGGNVLFTDAYDPVSGAWTTKAAMPTFRNQLAAVALEGKVYAVGGYNSGYRDENEAYDPATDSWATKSPMPTLRGNFAAAEVGGKLYAAGGYNGAPMAVTEEYDPALNSWTTKAAMPGARSYPAGAVVGGKLFVLGGYNGGSLAQNAVYDPAVNAWSTQAAMPIGNDSLAAAAVAGRIYVVGGSASANAHYEYVPGISGKFTGLTPNAGYSFKAKARNALGVETGESVVVSTYTLAAVAPPPGGQFFAGVYPSSVSVAWSSGTAYGGYNGPGARFLVHASTASNFSGAMISSETYSVDGAVVPLAPNTTYYLRVQAYNAGGMTDYSWLMMGSTVTRIETPTSVYIDEVGVSTIVASAYAPSPAFTGLDRLGSGVAVSSGNAYDLWGSTGNYWTAKAPMPVVRTNLAAGVIGGKLYAVGGSINRNDEYDPVSNTWTTRTAMNVDRGSPAAAVMGGKLYVFGGYYSTYRNENEAYDPIANAWETLAPMPTARQTLAAGAVGGKLYAVGGINGGYLQTNEEYDPVLDSWTTRAPMPTARYALAAGVISGKLYAVGGNNGAGIAVNQEYDPAGNSWTTKTSMPTPRSNLAAGVIGGKLYAVGGAATVSKNEEYDPLTDTWAARADMPTGRNAHAIGVIAGKLYAVGGYSGGNLDVNEEYVPGVARVFTGLKPNTQYTFTAKARGQDGTMTGESVAVSTYTLAYVGLPSGGNAFGAVHASSAAVNWSSGTATLGYNGAGARFLVVASTSPDYLGTNISSYTYNVSGATLALSANTTYYFRVQAYNAGGMTDYSWLVLGTTSTRIETPTSVYIDEVTTRTIVASAYAPNPAFTGMERGGSGVSIARDGTYDLWGSSGNYWTTKAAMPTARSALAVAALGGKLYALGGAVGFYSAANEVYDPAANSWATKTAMPTGRRFHAAAAIGGRLYVVGGENPAYLNTAEAYDPESNAWLTRAAMPTARKDLRAAALGGKLYAVGGDNGGPLAANEMYDPVTNAWATKASMAFARSGAAAAVIAGRLYVAGGYDGTALDVNEEYDPDANAWTTKASMPSARMDIVGGAAGGKLYALGRSVNYVYDPASDLWTERAPILTPRDAISVGVIGGGLYVIGGWDAAQLGKNESYAPGVSRSFTGLQPNSVYTFKTKARNQAGMETGDSVSVSTYTLAAAALPPSGQALTGVYASSVSVNWSSGTGTSFNGPGASFLVVASTSPDYLGVNVSSLTYNVAGATLPLSANTSYYFRLQAYNAGGMTDYSWLTLGSTVTLVNPPLPEDALAVSTYSITAQWGDNGNAPDTRYNVQLASVPSFSPVLVSSAVVGDYAELGPLPAANTYYFLRVNAVNRSGSPTAWVPLPSTATAVEAPVGVNFTSVSSSTLGTLFYSEGGAGFTNIALDLSGINQALGGGWQGWEQTAAHTFTGLAPNALYAAKARARNALGVETPETVEFTTHTLATVSLPQQGELFPVVYLASATVSWSSGTALTGFNGPGAGYLIEASTAADFTGTVVASATVALSAELELDRNTSYYFKALAYNVDNVTDYSWLVLGSTATEIETPTGINFTAVTATSVDLLVQGQPGFSRLDAGLSSIAKAKDGVYEAWFNSTAGTFPGLTPNTQYNFSAKARNLEGRETPEVSVSTWTLAVTPGPSDPAFAGVFVSSFTMAWSPATNPMGTTYYALISTAADFSAVYASSLTVNSSAVFSGLQANTTYYGRVAALNGAGISSAFADLGYVITRMEPPTSVYADEVTSTTIVVSAYAPGAAFTGMERGLSAVRLAKDGVYEAWGSSGNYWAARALLSANTAAGAAVALGGKVHLAGGWAGGPAFVNHEAYDPAANAWAARAPLPTGRHSLAAAVAGNKLYALGGAEGVSNLAVNEAYDPEANAWTTRAPMPTARKSLAAAEAGGKIYALGGTNGSTLAQNEEYDPAYDRWTAKAPLPTARYGLAAVVIGGQLYAVGGAGGMLINEKYDPALDTWGTRAPLPTGRYNMGAAVAGGKLYAIGGFNGAAVAVNEVYDPADDSWTPAAPLSSARYQIAAAVVKGRVYAMGGVYVGTNEMYEPGVSRSFSGLQPNTQYPFKAQARNQAGTATAESVEVTTYTLAAVALSTGATFTGVFESSVTVAYSSGTDAGGYNGPGAYYELHASTSTDFKGFDYLGAMYAPDDIFREVLDLNSNTTYYFRVKAWNAGGFTDYSWLSLGTTVTHAITPNAAAEPFSGVGHEGLAAQWGANNNSDGTAYRLQISSYSNFSLLRADAYPLYVTTSAIGGLTPNTTWYARAAAVSYSGVQTAYYLVGSTLTLMPQPAEILFTAVSTRTIATTAWSYYGFPNLAEGLSGLALSWNGSYGGWTKTLNNSFISLQPNSLHDFKAKARNQTGIETAESPEFSTFTLATVSLPQQGPLFSGVWLTSVTVNWSSGTVADGFNGPGADHHISVARDEAFTQIANGAATYNLSWSPEGLWPNTTHYFKARAVNNSLVANPDWLTLGSTSTLSNPVPDASVFEVWPTTVTLAWSTLPPAPSSDTCEGYLVQASTAPDFTGVIKSSATGDHARSSLVVLNLFAETTYYFRVGTLNWNGAPNYALAGSTWTPPENIPPTIDNNEPGTDYTWYGALPARTYDIDFHDTGGAALENFQVRATTGPLETGAVNADWTDILAGIDADDFTTDWTLTQSFWDLLADGTNFISVQAFDGSGNKAVEQDAFIVFKDTTPPAISHTYDGQVWRSTHGFSVSMSFSDAHSLVDEAEAGVWRGPGQGGGELIAWSNLFTNAAVQDRNEVLPIGPDAWNLLVDGTNYFSLRAWDYSLPVNTNTWVDAFLVLKDTTPPVAMAGIFAVDITTWSQTVTFGAPYETPSRLAEFAVQYASYTVAWATSAVAGSTHVFVSTGGANAGEDQYIPLTDLAENTTIYFRAWSRDLAGNWSGASPLAEIPTLARIPAYLGNPQFHYTSATITWDGLPAAAFRVEVSTDGAFDGAVFSSTTLTGAEVSVLVAGLAPNTTYFARAASLNWSGAANYAGGYEDSTLAVVPASAAVYAAVSSGSINVEWLSNGNGPGTKYFIDISSEDFPSVMYTALEIPAGPGPYTREFAGLLPNTTYWFRVLAAGNRGDSSDWLLLGSTVTTPVPPLLTGYTLWSASAAVTWDANGNGAGTLYQADLSTAADFTGALLSSVTGSAFDFSMGPITPNTTYYLRLRAVSSSTGQSSPYVGGAALALAAQPEGVGAWTIGPNNIGVYWDAEGNPGGLDLSAWVSGAGLPAARYGHAAAMAGDIAFLIGGYDGAAARAEVWYAPVTAAGVIGAWTQTRSLPAARYAHSAAGLQGRLYVVGGYDGSAPRSEVWSAPISSSGALGGWVAEEPLPLAVYAHAFISGENTLYVLGGYNGGARNNVWHTRVNADGSLVGWTPGPALTEAVYSVAASMNGSHLYLSGGYDGLSAKNKVWRSAIDGAGAPVGWIADTALPSGVHAHAMEAVPGALVVSGGNGGTLARAATLRGPLNADGSVAYWSAGPALPAARQSHIMFSRGSRIGVLGGYDGASAKTDGYYSTLAGTEFRLQITGAPFTETPWMAAGWQDAGSLVPNSYYVFRPLARNYAGIEAEGAVTFSTFTHAAQPSTAPISGVYISSAQANWLANDNPAGTRYQAQLSSDAAHTQLAYSSETVNAYAVFEGLAGNYSYYARVRAVNDVDVATAWTALGSTTTRSDPALDFSSPTVTINAAEPGWLNHGATLYDIDFADAGGAWLSSFEVRAATFTASPDAPWTPVAAGMNVETYGADWALPAGLFDLLPPGTSYISLRAWDANYNSSTTLDAFSVLKDTSAPVITDLQTGEDGWRMDDAGAAYNVDFADEVSGLAAIEYSASSNQGTGDAAGLAWAPIISISTGLKAYSDNWAVDFAALPNDATSYISVRARDLAGNTVSVTGIDVFKLLKYVAGPEIGITAPDSAYHSALALVTGTANDARSHAAAAVEVSLREDSSGKYWDGAGFLAASPAWQVAAGTGPWTYAHGIPWLENYSYQVVARASDTAGNYSLNYATRSFTYDSLAPVIAPLSPAGGALVNSASALSGTAYDASGLAGMSARFQRLSDDKWWDFGAATWTVAGSSAAVTPAAGWSYSLPALLAASLENGASYYYTLYAVDNSSPVRSAPFYVYGSTFGFVDNTAPAAVADLTASSGSAPGNIQLNWTAPGDDGALGMILYGQYRVQYSTASGIAFSTADAQVTGDFTAWAAGASRAGELTGLAPGTEYFLRLWTRDDAGNWSALSNGATAQASPFPDSVRGHVMTVSSAGITGVLVEAFDSTGLLRRSGYTVNDGSGSYVLAGLPAGSYRVQATWEADDIISSVGTDGIPLGASNADFTLSITYDLASIGGELAGYRLSALGFRTQAVRPQAAQVELYQRGRLVATAPVDANGRFLISNLLPGKYVLKVPDPAGGTKELSVRVKPGEALMVSPLGELLKTDKVYVYPNPASRIATFHIESDQFPLRVQLAVFDITGRLIAKLGNETFVSRNGGLEADWEIPSKVAPGVYIYSLHVKHEVSGEHRKVIKKFAIVK
jgi:N-acetylneuraminic acid mutarotase